jgi:ubiquinone/menaquinone biosynthesis C-methylase UbiE
MQQSDGFYDNYARFYDITSTGLDGDVEFYTEEAARAGGDVLELACGTARITIPIARSGVDIVGLDRSEPMLAIARRKLESEPAGVRQRVSLISGDMRDFDLGHAFKLIIIPYRAFLHLDTVEDQRRCLDCVRKHMAADGKFIFNVFDPHIDVIAGHRGWLGHALKFMQKTTHPETGNPLMVWESRQYDPATQMLQNLFIYEELNESGEVIKKSYNPLSLRWVYRFEMHHLLELCGFRIVELYGDFARGPFRHGGE